MHDLFSPHPLKFGLWRYRGRMEDLIKTSDGETFLPKEMEGIIESCEGVEGAIVCDAGEAGLGAVIELDEDGVSSTHEVVRDMAWETVERANGVCPIEKRVRKESVIWLDKGSRKGKGMLRGTKGYPVRKAVVQMFRREIEALNTECGDGVNSKLY